MAFPFPDFRHDLVFNLFKDIHSTVGARKKGKQKTGHGIAEDTYADGLDHQNCRIDYQRTSQELMMTLGKHAGAINIGPYSDYITRDELKSYLVRAGSHIASQDSADLLQVMRDFKSIAKNDGKGISYRDMAIYAVENQDADRKIMISRENEKLWQSNQSLRAQSDYQTLQRLA